jgi:hypothetical protein
LIFEHADISLWQAIPLTPGADMVLFLASLLRFFLNPVRSQTEGILEEYVAFYNTQRPHQGIRQQIPNPGEAEMTSGPIRKIVVLGGLHHHYSRRAA